MEFGTHFFGDALQAVDEVADGSGVDLGVGAGEGFESLVGLGVAFTTQDGLNSFGHYAPAVVQVGMYGFGIKDKFSEALESGLDGDDCVRKRHTDVAEHGRVGEVTLQPRHGELLCQMCEQSVGHAYIAFGVLEVYGIHFVRHRRRTDLAFLDALLEVVHRDVLPYVAVKVKDNGVETTESIEQRAEVIVIRNLRGEALALYAEIVAEELGSEYLPVNAGECHPVGVEVARGSAEFTRDRH